MKQIIRHDFNWILLESDLEDALYEDYSGRSMNGRTCLALEMDRELLDIMDEKAQELVQDGEIEYNPIPELSSHAKTDNLGRNTITYFPGYELTH